MTAPILTKFLQIIALCLSLSHQALAKILSYSNSVPREKFGDLKIRTEEIRLCKLMIHTNFFKSNAFIQTISGDISTCQFGNQTTPRNIQAASSLGSTTYVMDASKEACVQPKNCDEANCCGFAQCAFMEKDTAVLCRDEANTIYDVAFKGESLYRSNTQISILERGTICDKIESCKIYSYASEECEVFASITEAYHKGGAISKFKR